MKRTVNLSPVEANLAVLAVQNRDKAIEEVNTTFNQVVMPILRAHTVTVKQVSLDPDGAGGVIMSWDDGEAEPSKPKLKK